MKNKMILFIISIIEKIVDCRSAIIYYILDFPINFLKVYNINKYYKHSNCVANIAFNQNRISTPTLFRSFSFSSPQISTDASRIKVTEGHIFPEHTLQCKFCDVTVPAEFSELILCSFHGMTPSISWKNFS